MKDKEKFGKIGKLLKKALKERVVSKRILKPKATLTIKQKKPAPYVPIYFKNEMEETKKSMFFE